MRPSYVRCRKTIPLIIASAIARAVCKIACFALRRRCAFCFRSFIAAHVTDETPRPNELGFEYRRVLHAIKRGCIRYSGDTLRFLRLEVFLKTLSCTPPQVVLNLNCAIPYSLCENLNLWNWALWKKWVNWLRPRHRSALFCIQEREGGHLTVYQDTK